MQIKLNEFARGHYEVAFLPVFEDDARQNAFKGALKRVLSSIKRIVRNIWQFICKAARKYVAYLRGIARSKGLWRQKRFRAQFTAGLHGLVFPTGGKHFPVSFIPGKESVGAKK
jgi:hypothetical protein